MRHIANVVTPSGVRGFDSRPLRHAMPQGPDRDAARGRPLPPARQGLAWVAVSIALCACQVQREFVITSEPAGAEVRLDDDLVGRTPVQVPFMHYGTRRFTVYLDGYVTQSRVVDVDPPWYGYFPLDIVSEVLIPVGWHDRREVHFQLAPGTGAIAAPDLSWVLERAETLRRAGPEGPSPSPAPPPASETPATPPKR